MPDTPGSAQAAVVPARLCLGADGTPRSETYGDIYHATAGGLGQARHVFLAGNDLPQRWQGHERFVIVETGFGLGLNFLATWAAWRDDPQRCERLHFVSIEKHPFTADDLATLHAAWPELAALATALQAQWPPLVPALHRLQFEGGRVVLDLVFGDATYWLPQLDVEADALYLDGFSPAKNPDLWCPELLGALSSLAAPGATLATWSVAGSVREALAAHGWLLEKTAGFAGKREMLRGTRPTLSPHEPGQTQDNDQVDPAAAGKCNSAFACGAGTHKRAMVPGAGIHHCALVLGAGLAGSTVANRLAARGWQVTIIDAAAGPGKGASGNRAGVLRPLPARDDGPLAQITRAGFLATRRHLDALATALPELADELIGRSGVLHLARDATHEATQRRIVAEQAPPADYLRFVEREEAARLCGWPVSSGGWWFPGGGWVSPAAYCKANLLQYRNAISTRYGIRIDRIAYTDGRWQALDAQGCCVAEAAQMIVANAADARRLLGDWLPVFPARGQVTHLPAAPTSAPHCVVCRLGYVTPEIAGERYAGATFLMKDADAAVRDADHAENLAKLEFMLPGYSAGLAPAGLPGRTGFRPASPDRLPIIGAVPRLGEDSAPPGLWLANGFGARGIVWSALAGELLADQMTGAPAILPHGLAQALAPQRFLGRRPRRTDRK
ncbi:MAG: bifunctional tRNA (5-methylaminomethyl-2-thiouridine)(34)-methyltransferase MnmD/FAD-dependent 5-carboxymethylaminomethyl-2-thiouridine(34) oxidoreductase MnmC [Rhodocyclaceae bacterium]|nr:bifunctional tRNA (5-methylaminomethyl-2-thiouridine)(34)-methyltransferase MnmD/FAD-dependent 5-carboxymethylaminomethyl-2-thiouridine(34) oxidoreductase MnmC [Rhodocyclaceae bacterium]